MSLVKKSWRDAASLIVLAKQNRVLSNNWGNSVNYDVLLQTRTKKSSFPNSIVFPGGVTESSDADEKWLQLFNNFGYTQLHFDAFHCVGTPITPIFHDNPIKRHIALRITAIRETFEELGLLICSNKHRTDRNDVHANFVKDLDVNYWRQKVSQNPAEFINLCEEYNCYPDIWSLYYWSNWLSPVSIPVRFDTVFFIATLGTKPSDIKPNSEVYDVKWSNPLETLDNKKIVLPPPQVYELHRLTHIKNFNELAKFARERSSYGNELYYSVDVQTKDGLLQVLPGDDLYPSSLNYNNDIIKHLDKTVLELRESSHTLHRIEKIGGSNYFIIRNYKQNNHINMGDKVMQTQYI